VNDKKLTLQKVGPGEIRLGIGASAPFTAEGEIWFSGGTSVSVRPVATHAFSYWSGTAMPSGFNVISSSEQSFPMDGDYDLTAHFTGSVRYTLTVNVDDTSSAHDGYVEVRIDGNPVGTATHTSSFVMTVDASAGVGLKAKDGTVSVFSYWSGSLPAMTDLTAAEQTFSMGASYDITARFTGDTYHVLSVSVADPSTQSDGSIDVYVNGDLIFTVTSSAARSMNVSDGWTVKLVAKDGTTSSFSHWKAETNVPSTMTDATAASQTFTMAAPYDLTAVFGVAANMRTLVLSADGPGKISVTIGGITMTGTSFSLNLARGTGVTVTAGHDAGAHFSHWNL
jgi:hypothetical protein